jgi:hypothetical protein
LYEYVKSKPTIGWDPEGLLGAMPDDIDIDLPVKNCGILTLFTLLPADEGMARIRGLRRKGEKRFRNAFAIETLEVSSISKQMCRDCCDCYREIRIHDHSNNGKQGWAYKSTGQHLDASKMKMLCPFLCWNSLLRLNGCDLGINTTKSMLQHLFDACPKISRVKTCTAGVGIESERCSGWWKTFRR